MSRGMATLILDLGTRWRLVVNFIPQLREWTSHCHWIGGWVGQTANRDAVKQKTISTTVGN